MLIVYRSETQSLRNINLEINSYNKFSSKTQKKFIVLSKYFNFVSKDN